MTQDRLFHDVSFEKIQNYWNERPCNIRHSSKTVGSREYFDEVETRKYFVEPHISGFADFPRWKGKKVLEIGCGIGTDTINFARHGAIVTAVDCSKESLEIARERAAVYELDSSIEFHYADAENLSTEIPLGKYDLVYSFGVIHHTPHPEKAIQEARKFMRQGSTIKLMVYHRYAWKVFWILLAYGKCRFWKLDELIARYSEAQSGCPVTYTYNKRGIMNILQDNGFEVSEIFADHIFPYRIADYVNYRYIRTWYFQWMPPSVFRYLERRLGWHLCVTGALL